MITLITGTPGAGKTAWIVAELLKLAGSRPVFVDGIPELTIAHEVAGPVDEWHKWAPEGALIIVDEVQRIWRPRSPGAKVPEAVAQLETHRHRGIDFWLISQHPNLLDGNVRRLISRHIHLVVTWAGRYQYEWPEVNPSPDTKRAAAVKRPYKLPAKVFDNYKSASVHTKIKKRVPLALYGLALAVCLAVVVGWRVYTRVDEVMHPELAGSVAEASDAVPAARSVGGTASGDDPINFAARVAGRPETAPAYDQLRQVKAFPRVAGCALSVSRGCQCYTQQATRYEVPEAVCREIVEGNVFDPYADPAPMPQPVAPSAPVSESVDPLTV